MTVTLATLSLLSRYLGPDEFGRYQFVIAFLLLVNVSDFGISTIAVRHLSTGQRDPDELIGNVVVVRSILAAASTVIAVSVALIVGYPPEIQLAIAVASLSFPLMIASGAYTAAFAANLRMEFVALGSVVQGVVTLGGMLLVVAAGGGLIELLLAFNAGLLANSVVCWLFVRRFVRPKLSFDRDYSFTLVKQGAPLGLAVLIMTAYGRLDIIILRAFTEDSTVGFYGFAYRVVDLGFPLSFFFVGSIFPLLSAYHAERRDEEFRAMYWRAHDVLSVGAVGVITVIVMFASPIVRIIGGPEYEPAIRMMQLLVGAVALIWWSNLADHGLIAIGKQGLLLWIALMGLVVNITANLILIPPFGGNGAALSTLLTETAVLAPAAWIIARHTQEGPSFVTLGRTILVALVSAAVVYALPLHWTLELALVASLFAVGLLAMRVTTLAEIRDLLGRPAASDMRRVGGAEAGVGN
jgi:O-antigen/teichoic acid export membrane protein